MTLDDELHAAIDRMTAGEDPVAVLRTLSPAARQYVVRGLSRRDIDVVGGIPVRRPGAPLDLGGAGDTGRVPSKGTADEQADDIRHRGETTRVNGWGRRW